MPVPVFFAGYCASKHHNRLCCVIQTENETQSKCCLFYVSHSVNETASLHVHHFVSVASIYLHVFVNHSWWKVRIASGAQALIKEGACMWAWDWAWVGEGLLGEHEIQGMDLAVHKYVPVQSCVCGKWSHCIICISPPVVSEPGFGRRIGRSEEGEKKMEAELSAAQWRKLLLSWALVWAATWLILADYYMEERL